MCSEKLHIDEVRCTETMYEYSSSFKIITVPVFEGSASYKMLKRQHLLPIVFTLLLFFELSLTQIKYQQVLETFHDLSTRQELSVADIECAGDDYACVRRRILLHCGDLCGGKEKMIISKQEPFDYYQVPLNCRNLHSAFFFDTPSTVWPPPKKIPEPFRNDYLMDGNVTLKDYYLEQRYNGEVKPFEWTEKLIDGRVEDVRLGRENGSYGSITVETLKNSMRKYGVEGQNVLVVGSQKPWVEAIALHCGAAHVYTLEYAPIHSTHPQVTTYLPQEYNQAFLDGTLPVFDVIVSFSSRTLWAWTLW